MSKNKKLMLRFEFDQNEINELILEQEQDDKDETRIEPPWVEVGDNGKLYTVDRSLKNRELSDNQTTS